MYNATLHEAKALRQPGASEVSWFPSGTELLFQARDRSGISQLFRSRINGTAKQQITKNTDGPAHDARLSPDGRFVLYTTPGASVSIIYTVELATGAVHEVKGGPDGKNYFPEWSPDSLRIAYNATLSDDRGYFSQIRTVERLGRMIGYGRFQIAFQHQLLGHLTEERLLTLLGVKGKNLPMSCGFLM